MNEDPMLGARGARSEILERIRSANRALFSTGRHLAPDQSWRAIPRAYRQDSSLTRAARIQLLTERLLDYGAGVYLCQQAEVADNIANILRSRMKQKILIASDVDPCWLPDGPTYVHDNGLTHAEIEGCDGVLTGCAVAIAMTGTLALSHTSPGNRRTLTLLPDYHLCVVDGAAIVETVPEGFRALEPHRTQPITLISGPSATADIEMTRIQGVHGPRVLDCVIVV